MLYAILVPITLYIGAKQYCPNVIEYIKNDSMISKIGYYLTYQQKYKYCCTLNKIQHITFKDYIIQDNQIIHEDNIKWDDASKIINDYTTTLKYNKKYANILLLTYTLNDKEEYMYITELKSSDGLIFDKIKLDFIEEYINPYEIDKKIISCNYNDYDITLLINKYMSPNHNFHKQNIDFRYLVNDNMKQIYYGDDNITFIYGNLDMKDIRLEVVNYNSNIFVL